MYIFHPEYILPAALMRPITLYLYLTSYVTQPSNIIPLYRIYTLNIYLTYTCLYLYPGPLPTQDSILLILTSFIPIPAPYILETFASRLHPTSPILLQLLPVFGLISFILLPPYYTHYTVINSSKLFSIIYLNNNA